MVIDNEDYEDDDIVVKYSYGNILKDGDSVFPIRDLKVKGTSKTFKHCASIKNIRLTSYPENIECNADGIKGLVLITCFLKKA